MAEPTVPVPVSLIERIIPLLDERWPSAASDELRALVGMPPASNPLLPQRTPTAEAPMCGETLRTKNYVHECVEDAEHRGRHMSVTGIWWTHNSLPAAPLSIADMVPGTRFTAVIEDGVQRCQFERINVAPDTSVWKVFEPGTGHYWNPDAIDPSTIRDVVPPAGA